MVEQNLKQQLIDLLGPSGSGIQSISAGSDRIAHFQREYYLKDSAYGPLTTQERESILGKWESTLEKGLQEKAPFILGVCSDSGGGILRGANWGPLFLRRGLYPSEEWEKCCDLGDVKIIPQLLHDNTLNEKTIAQCRQSLYGKEQVPYPVSPLSQVEFIGKLLRDQKIENPIFSLGGDHSISLPLVQHFARRTKAKKKKCAIIHFDAHTDLLSQRLGIEHCFSTWAYHARSELASAGHLIQLGIRESAHDKIYWERETGVKQYWAQEFAKRSEMDIAVEVADFLHAENIEELYISLDIDALDSSYVSATGTPAANGLSPHHIAGIIDHLGTSFVISGADIVEVAPLTSPQKTLNPEPQSTLLVASTLGEKILTHLLAGVV